MKWLISLIIRLLLNGAIIFFSARFVDGVSVSDDFGIAFYVAVVFAFINTFIKPIVNLITLPLRILTLGLFTLALNVIGVIAVANLIDGFEINGLLPAFIFSIILTLGNGVVNVLTK